MNRLHFGVALGINRYPDIRHLLRAKGDAEAFAKWLADPAGGGLPASREAGAIVDGGHVVTVVVDDAKMPDGTPRENALPVRRDVFVPLMKFRKAVEAHVAQHPEDWIRTRLYIYVSGHGIAPKPKDAAILLADAGPGWFGENISCAQLLEFFSETQPFREVVIFADCCRERVTNAPLGGLPWEVNAGNNGNVVTVLGCATYFGDLAYEPPVVAGQAPDDQRGYFTQALLEGLRGEAPRNGTGVIDSTTLASYVRDRVWVLTKDRMPRQIPVMDADPANPVVFGPAQAVHAPQSTHRIRIVFPTGFTGTAVLRDGMDVVLGAYAASGGPATVHLPNGLYSMTADDPIVNFAEKGIFRILGSDRNVQL